MSAEADIATYLKTDATLLATLAGGIYTSAEVGREGITRETVPAAFDGDGYLLPCALVKQRGLTPDNVLVEQETPAASGAQVVDIYVYEDTGYSSIDAALARLRMLLLGHQLANTFPLEWLGDLPRERDDGALQGASMARQEWLVVTVYS